MRRWQAGGFTSPGYKERSEGQIGWGGHGEETLFNATGQKSTQECKGKAEPGNFPRDRLGRGGAGDRKAKDQMNRRDRTSTSQGNSVFKRGREGFPCHGLPLPVLRQRQKMKRRTRVRVSRPDPNTSLTGTQFLICKVGPRHQPYCVGPLVASPIPFLLIP